MPYIWYREEDGWMAYPLTDKPLALNGLRPTALRSDHARGESADEETVAMFRVDGGGLSDTWTLLWGRNRSVRLGGLHIPTGVHVLADRDEIKVDANEPVVFSAETLVRVETFPGSEIETRCPRCLKTIEAGSSVVRCPECLVWYHHGEQKDTTCWLYAPTCACGHPTAMDTGLKWTPEAWE
jgi:hypothetical protein